ncbi:MAG: methylmalonyl-CoA mutase [Candidatus Neomarinimicrobiota bacterium]|nr:MAG: methylmalonyl-CoA mutase [Candidatus Neomarinimicrobiota bacterium]
MKDEKPGVYPFTRGIYSNMYKDRLWTMRQYAGLTSAKESNKRYHSLLKQGVMGLSVAFDLPTQIGYDSDNPLAAGEVGKVGVPISSIENMDILFDNIPLEKISTSMTINATAPILLAFYISTAENQGVTSKKLKGTIQNDILKEYTARGTYIYPPDSSMRLITDVMDFCESHLPYWNTISISGYHIREAGSTVVQELAFTFANAIAYIEAAIKKGLDPNKFGEKISFFFNAHNGFLEEISKFRAARKLWATIMKERFSVTNEKALLCRFHVQTGGSTLTAQQVDNNIVRTSIQALSAILGGTQSLHTNSKDEALALPSLDSAKTALRTQQIIAYESGVTEHPDPFGGSYVIEKMTKKFFNASTELIEKIDSMGGAIEAINNGFVEHEISNSAYEYQKNIDSNQKIIVGVNKFEDEDEDINSLQNIDPVEVEKQIKGLSYIQKNSK